MSRKVAVVTGANKGIGFAIVRRLCESIEGDIYLTSRDEKSGNLAVDILWSEGFSPLFHQLDITSKKSISNFRDYLSNTHGGIDILINNAGVAYSIESKEPFWMQAEETTRVNYFGTKAVCDELFPLLRPGARVVNISSSSGHLSAIHGQEPQASKLRELFCDPNLTYDDLDGLINNFVELAKIRDHFENGWPNNAYAVSKVGVSALTRIQQREMDKERPNDGILINHVHPGYTNTDLTEHKGFMTPEEGAEAPTYLALLPPESKLKGAYVWYDKTELDWINKWMLNFQVLTDLGAARSSIQH